MNGLSAEHDADRPIVSLRETAARIAPARGQAILVDVVLDGVTDSFFAVESPLGAVYVVAGGDGVRDLPPPASGGGGVGRRARGGLGGWLFPPDGAADLAARGGAGAGGGGGGAAGEGGGGPGRKGRGGGGGGGPRPLVDHGGQ